MKNASSQMSRPLPIERKTIYTLKNKTFMVETKFSENRAETLGTILARLMKADIEKS